MKPSMKINMIYNMEGGRKGEMKKRTDASASVPGF